MKSPITELSRPQPAGESVARRLLWGQSTAPQIASKFGAGELTRLSSIYPLIPVFRCMNTVSHRRAQRAQRAQREFSDFFAPSVSCGGYSSI